MVKLLCASIIALVMHMWSAEAQAQETTSESALEDGPNDPQALFNEGATAFESGDFAAALAKFEQSYELSRLPELLFNIASCHDRLGTKDEAVRHYEAYLAAVPEAANREYVGSRLVLLREVEVGDVVPLAETTPVAPDFTEETGPSVAGPVSLMALGGAVLVGAVVTGALTASSRSDLEAACDGLVCPRDAQGTHDKMQRRALTTDILTGVSLALLTSGVVWLLLQRKTPDEETVEVACGIRGCAASVRF